MINSRKKRSKFLARDYSSTTKNWKKRLLKFQTVAWTSSVLSTALSSAQPTSRQSSWKTSTTTGFSTMRTCQGRTKYFCTTFQKAKPTLLKSMSLKIPKWLQAKEHLINNSNYRIPVPWNGYWMATFKTMCKQKTKWSIKRKVSSHLLMRGTTLATLLILK